MQLSPRALSLEWVYNAEITEKFSMVGRGGLKISLGGRRVEWDLEGGRLDKAKSGVGDFYDVKQGAV